MLAPLVSGLALLVAAAGEIAWWEGRWVDRWMSCTETAGDRQPFILLADRLSLGEAECSSIREKLVASRLVLTASCRDHGDPTVRSRTFTLTPKQGGRAIVLSDGSGVWHLRKCVQPGGFQ